MNLLESVQVPFKNNCGNKKYYLLLKILYTKAAFLKEFDNLRKWTDKSLMKASIELHLIQRKSMKQHRLGTNCL